MSSLRTSIHGQWSSRWIFILAATGSAVGLGNIWRFPYLTGENGGGAFVLVYLFCVIIMGIRNDHTGNLSTNWNVITKNMCSCKLKHYLNYLEEPDISTDISQKLFSKAKKLVKGQGQSVVDLKGYGPTMRAEHHGNIEFRNDKRRLSVREAGLIQTFSPTFKFTEKSMSLPYKFIGNAVPPLLSYLIADKVNFLLTNYF